MKFLVIFWALVTIELPKSSYADLIRASFLFMVLLFEKAQFHIDMVPPSVGCLKNNLMGVLLEIQVEWLL